jgi:uncharacterized protein YacL
MLVTYWPAFYIAMLQDSRPIKSMRLAAELTKYHRTKILGRVISIFINLILLFLLVVTPVSLISQRLIPVVVYIMLIVLFGVMHIMLFSLYRSLVDAKQSKR